MAMTITKEIASEIIKLATKHADNRMSRESATICLTDANSLYDKQLFEYSAMRALRSLTYSIGIFEEDYKTAQKLIFGN